MTKSMQQAEAELGQAQLQLRLRLRLQDFKIGDKCKNYLKIIDCHSPTTNTTPTTKQP